MSYSQADIDEAKQHIAENYSAEDQLKLKQLAEILRTPMNRRQRRALQSRSRRVS